jgi:hypothetical protein
MRIEYESGSRFVQRSWMYATVPAPLLQEDARRSGASVLELTIPAFAFLD